MFNKSNENSFSILDSSVDVICNKLQCKNIDVLGKMSGFIEAKNIFIKGNGSITGDVFCAENLKMEKGFLEGNIVANYIYLYKGASLKGTIKYVNLHVEEGAFIESNDIKKITQEELDKILKKDIVVDEI